MFCYPCLLNLYFRRPPCRTGQKQNVTGGYGGDTSRYPEYVNVFDFTHTYINNNNNILHENITNSIAQNEIA